MRTDTIAAIATPTGEGAIALVRVSGPQAQPIADQIFQGAQKPSAFPSHTQRLGHVIDGDQRVDEVLLSVHRAPNSYTGEDLVEISCHGGILVTARVLEAVLRAGARSALPGEFTERAFHRGKMDLTQAEAVIDLIRARTDLALKAAHEQLQGTLGQQIRAGRDQLIALLANIEAAVDFPEEGIEPASQTQIQEQLTEIRQGFTRLLATAERGRILREGVRAVIYGPTNAGKSSLLNRLLGYERAIVSRTPGTTRDTIEEVIHLRGVPIRLLDTAGLRDAVDEIEAEGMARTQQSLATADLRLHLFDRNAPQPSDFAGVCDSNELLLLNKRDLPEHRDWQGVEALRLSCVTGEGFDDLTDEVLRRVGMAHLQPENSIAINTRHRDCLRRAEESCARAAETLAQGLSSEYAAADLRVALSALGEILGEIDNEEILDVVFGQFCIGK
jgi:tRNA modification GTPase